MTDLSFPPPSHSGNLQFVLFPPGLSHYAMRMSLIAFFADMQFTLLGFHVTFNWWKVVGWSGNLVFGTRFLIQWIASERAGHSIIPKSFWVVSALGSLCLLTYFVFYRRDSVGIFSAVFPLPIYLRNLYLQVRHDAALRRA